MFEARTRTGDGQIRPSTPLRRHGVDTIDLRVRAAIAE